VSDTLPIWDITMEWGGGAQCLAPQASCVSEALPNLDFRRGRGGGTVVAASPAVAVERGVHRWPAAQR